MRFRYEINSKVVEGESRAKNKKVWPGASTKEEVKEWWVFIKSVAISRPLIVVSMICV